MTVRVYSDGSAGATVGLPGAWAFVVLDGPRLVAEGRGTVARTTSLLMELHAARAGLEAARAKGFDAVELCCDCSIVLDVVTGAFLPRPAALAAPCAALREAAGRLTVVPRKVKGHGDDAWNAHVDAAARAARSAAQRGGRSSPRD